MGHVGGSTTPIWLEPPPFSLEVVRPLPWVPPDRPSQPQAKWGWF
jgi:hypothetical protein